MVYYRVLAPVSLPPSLLDAYLAAGWYRMQQHIFTTDLITKDDELIPVFWLRHVVGRYVPSGSHQRISRRYGGAVIRVVPFQITGELEDLYQRYRAVIDFDIAPSLQDSLMGEATESVYHTMCIEVRDNDRLIAAGIFDEGQNSIAGILNFYDPDYSAKSPGKFLMLQKLRYCREHGKAFYYTGYMSTVFDKFDYKLMVGAASTEVYHRREDAWLPWGEVNREEMNGWL